MVSAMDQISLRLPKALRHKIKLRALREHRQESAVIRELLERGLVEKKPAKHGLQMLAELNLTGGPADLSSRIDDYLYGDAE